jgi:uncharacterized membrane protein (DUF2068 family)
MPIQNNRPLVLTWIIGLKAVETTTLTAVGVALLTGRHADPVEVLLRLALTVHLPLTSRLFIRLVTSASTLTIRRETALAFTAFAYAILMGSEGASLYLSKRWARWFTIIATSSLIPIELYEIARAVHPIRVLVLLANLAIVVYLFGRDDLFDI